MTPETMDVVQTGERPLEAYAQVLILLGDAPPIEVPVSSCVVTFDEAWAPISTVALTCPRASIPDTVDPRLAHDVVVHAGYRVEGGVDTDELGTFATTAITWSQPDDVVRLEASSAELRFMDNTITSGSLTWQGNAAIINIITYLLETYGGGNAVVIGSFPGALGTPLTLEVGDNLWAAVSDLADRIGAWVYGNGPDWVIRSRPEVYSTPPGPVGVFRTGPGGTITHLERKRDIARWANQALVRYDGGHGYAANTSAPYGVGHAPTKTIVASRTDLSTHTAADAAAASVLDRAIARAEAVTFTAAPAAYWLRPGDQIEVDDEELFVERVAFDVHLAQMTVATRRPVS